MKEWFKRITGIAKIEAATKAANEARAEALVLASAAKAEEEAAKKLEELAKMSPKERATANGEPWVAVLDTKVNKDNPRNGFFELDWNELFVLQLKQAGYGADGDPDEEIVDRWFRDLAYNMLVEEGVPEPDRVGSGFINVTRLADGKAQVE
jgi:hypothetical protein